MDKCHTILNYKYAFKVLTLLIVLCINKNWAQVLITTTSYTQNFGATDISSWTNNSTILGWYISTSSFAHANITTSPVPPNTGSFYSYECNGDDNQKLGTRPSNTVPGAVGTFLRFGVRLKNNTGQPIQSVRVTFDAYQFSLAGNGSVLNTLIFDYLVSSGTITSLTDAGYTAVAGLSFSAPQSTTSTSSGAQLAGYPCNQTQLMTACIPIFIPDNSEIMLRWADENNTNNDPHLGIDNLRVDFGITAADCSVILPIQLIDFYAIKKDSHNEVNWKVANEVNIDSYLIEKSSDGVNFSLLSITPFDETKVSNGIVKSYSIDDETPFADITYYRLGTNGKDGSIEYHKIISVNEKSDDWKSNHYQQEQNLVIEFKNSVPKHSSISLFDLSGKLLVEEEVKNSQTKINVQNFAEGIYFVKITTPFKIENFKIIIIK